MNLLYRYSLRLYSILSFNGPGLCHSGAHLILWRARKRLNPTKMAIQIYRNWYALGCDQYCIPSKEFGPYHLGSKVTRSCQATKNQYYLGLIKHSRRFRIFTNFIFIFILVFLIIFNFFGCWLPDWIEFSSLSIIH